MVNLEICPIQKEELGLLMQEEACKEGWSYSAEDVEFYFNCPQNQICVVKINHRLAGCVILHASSSLIRNKPLYSAGFFLVREQYRGQKVGSFLWQKAITEKLPEHAFVCFHSVPRAVDYYAKQGFKQTPLTNRCLILESKKMDQLAVGSTQPLWTEGTLRILHGSAKEDINAYTNRQFVGTAGKGFREFIQQWIKRPDAIAIGYYSQDRLQGYGIATFCGYQSNQQSYRISPLYAMDTNIAQAILKGLVSILAENGFQHIELNTLVTIETSFAKLLYEMGFREAGKNFVVCNYPDWVTTTIPLLNQIFCSIPLEYPHEAIYG